MTPVCKLALLQEGQARLARLGERHLLLYRAASNRVHAYLNRCPHLGIPLTWYEDLIWDPTRQHLQCLTHGALFTPETGFCVSGPCRGDSLWSIHCEIAGDEICIDESELPATHQS